MPQIEEAQFVYWGSMRPDVIPLAAPGITMAVGPNGSGKSCWLDGLKIILGVSDLSGNRTPSSYIFNGKPSGVPAEQAWLRATFANPKHPGQSHRVFAVAGPGLENVEHVTVVCRVRGDKRQYLFLPGRVTWGTDITAELDSLMERYPESRWRGPDQYDAILTRAGVTKALRGVLALPQGATDRLVAERPTGLMKRLLDLTGRQETLEKFRLARAKHDEAVIAHREAKRRYEQKTADVERLEFQVGQHRIWIRDVARLTEIDEILLPAARHFDADNALANIDNQIKFKDSEKARLRQEEDELWRIHHERLRDLEEMTLQLPGLSKETRELKEDISETDTMYGQAHERFVRAWGELMSARSATAGMSLREIEKRVVETESALTSALQARLNADGNYERTLADLARIRSGGTLAPPEVRAFTRELRLYGVDAAIVADTLGAARDDARAAHLQAALGDAVWGILVPDSQYRTACARAVETAFTWPIVRREGRLLFGMESGPESGAPGLHGLLETLAAAEATNVDEAMRLNAAGFDATTPDGMRHTPIVSRLSPIRQPVLHPDAQARVVEILDDAANRGRERLAGIEDEVPSLRAQLIRSYELANTFSQLEFKKREFRSACRFLAQIRIFRHWIGGRFSAISGRENDLLERIREARSEIERINDNASGRAADANKIVDELNGLSVKRNEFMAELSAHPLPDRYDATEDPRLDSAELRVERGRLVADVDDLSRFPLDIRAPIIVDQYNAEKDRLSSVEELIRDKSEEMEQRSKLVQNARESYNNHIAAVVRELRMRFIDICSIAGIVGDVRLIQGDAPDEYGVDVLVSHKAGENPVSYQDDSHSGGQGTKISILLLLAAMSLGRTADLLIVDEHKAHLDGTNNSQIVEIMRSLGKKVQFVLSAPTNTHDASEESDWCDVQVAFLPREPGAMFSPPVRLMSRLDATQIEERFQSLQQPLI